MTNKKKYRLSEFGLSLIMTAFPMAMYYRTFIDDVPIGNFFMLMGVLFLFPYKNFVKTFQTMRWNKDMVLLIVFQLVALLYYYISNFNDNTYSLFHYLIIAFGVALTYTRFDKDLCLHNAILWIGIESFFCAIMGYYVLDSGMVEILIDEMDKDERILDYLTISGVCVTNVACCTYFMGKSNRNVVKIILFLCIFFDFLVINLTQKRTPFIVALLIVVIYLYKQLSDKTKRNTTMIMLVAVFAYFFASIYKDMLTDNMASIFNGIDDFINGTYQLEDTNSASQRYYNREKALEIISRFTTEEYLFGKGYMTLWFDNPLMQSYLDMGIFGVVFCFYFSVWIPVKTLFSKKIYDNYIFWAFSMASYVMVGCMSTGHPYSHNKWLPICLLIFIINGVISKGSTQQDCYARK